MDMNGHRVYFGDASQGYALTQVIFNGEEEAHGYSAAYFAGASEHVTLTGDSVIHWNHAERVVTLPEIDPITGIAHVYCGAARSL